MHKRWQMSGLLPVKVYYDKRANNTQWEKGEGQDCIQLKN